MAWWNSSWSKKKKITLTGGTSGTQTNYQLKLAITYDSDMRSDFSDLRFTNGAEDTLIDCWLESKVDATSAVVWVEFPTTPANTVEQTYYMYYGNSGASNVWNIANTFVMGDDFETGDLTTGGISWTPRQCSESSGVAHVTNGAGTYAQMYASSSYCRGYAWAFKFEKIIAGNLNIYIAIIGTSNTWYPSSSYAINIADATHYDVNKDGAIPFISGNWDNDTNEHLCELTLDSTGEFELFYDGVSQGTATDTSYTASSYTSFMVCNDIDMDMDDYRVRKFVTNPATYGFGSEQAQWLTGWGQRKKITLTGNASGAQTDYQIKLIVPYDSDMQVDFDDLRFTQSDGSTLIDCWLGAKTDSTSAVVFVEFPTTPANAVTQDYYMYYGNSGVSNVWNGTDTFEYFDDFSDGNYTGWTVEESQSGDSVSAATYELVLDKGGVNGNFHLSGPNQGQITALKRWVCKRKMTTGNTTHYINGDVGGASGSIYVRMDNGSAYYYAGGYVTLATGLTNDNWYYVVVIPDVSTDTFDIHIYTDAWVEVTYSSGGINIGCAFRNNTTYMDEFWVCAGTANEDNYTDVFLVYKYATNPSTYAFGNEEGGGGTLVTIMIHLFNLLRG